MDPGALGKRVLESLILAGAFESMGYTRRGLLENFDKVSIPISAQRKAEAAGQFSLFGGGGDTASDVDASVLIGTPEFDKRNLLRQEKEVLGQYVTDHPLLEVAGALAAQTDTRMNQLTEQDDGVLVTVGGIISTVNRRFTKQGKPYALFRVEDLVGGVSIVAFPNIYEGLEPLIQPDEMVVVRGHIDRRGRELQLRGVEIAPLRVQNAVLDQLAASVASGPVVVEIPAANCTNGMLLKLKEILSMAPGPTAVHVVLIGESGPTPLRLGDGYRVDVNDGLLSELRLLLGSGSVRVDAPA